MASSTDSYRGDKSGFKGKTPCGFFYHALSVKTIHILTELSRHIRHEKHLFPGKSNSGSYTMYM